MDGLPRVNLGALLMAPVWGPAHGIWASILFYPAWLVADNAFYAAASEPTPLTLYAMAVVAWFIEMCVMGHPHPAWAAFLTIPLVTWLLNALSHWWQGRKASDRHGVLLKSK